MFPEFVGAVQNAYVNVARAELKATGTSVSIEAIHVMTEVEPACIDEILSAPDDAALREADRRMHSAARLLVGWHTDREYIGPYGLVRDLPFSKAEGSKKEAGGFVELAKRYCPSIAPKVLLDELIRTGCVQDLGNGYYRALTRSYVPEQLSAESLRHFAQVVHHIVDTLAVNLRRSVRGTGRVERTVFADFGLPRNELPAFDKYIRERGQLFADDIDNWLSDRSHEGTPDVVQTGIGYYHYVVNQDDEQDFNKALQAGDKQ